MKPTFLTLMLAISVSCFAQNDSARSEAGKYATYERHSVIVSASLGFFDMYRQSYTLPSGFEKGNISGFTPIFAKLEYGLYDHISIAATCSYNNFVYNYKQDFTGNNGPFIRNLNDHARIWSLGVAGFYHLGDAIHVKHLDPFIGVGLSLNNIRYNAYPQGDSTVTKFDHEVTPYLKVGARYYLTSRFSLYADAGYEKQAIVSIGASCRFFSRKKAAK